MLDTGFVWYFSFKSQCL